MDLYKYVFFSSRCILTLQVMLLPEYDLYEAEILVSVASYDAHTFTPKGLTRFVREELVVKSCLLTCYLKNLLRA